MRWSITLECVLVLSRTMSMPACERAPCARTRDISCLCISTELDRKFEHGCRGSADPELRECLVEHAETALGIFSARNFFDTTNSRAGTPWAATRSASPRAWCRASR